MRIHSVTETVTDETDDDCEEGSLLYLFRRMEKELSKLTDAVAGLQTEVTALSGRIDAEVSAKDAQIATATAESDAAATTIANLTAQVAALALAQTTGTTTAGTTPTP